MSPRILVIAATRAEVAHLPSDLPVVITGLGKTTAAIATARALAERSADGGLDGLVVWNLGSAGALREGLEGIHVPGAVLNHDLSGDAIRALGFDPEDHLVVEGGDETVLATGDVFVTDPVVRARLAERAHLVDMEGYAVALACRRFDVPVRLVKHVSDNADETAHDWVDVIDHSARALAAWAEANLP